MSSWGGSGGAGGASNGTAGGNGTAPKAGGGPSAYPAQFARRTAANEMQMRYYASALAGILGVFVLFHLGRVLAQRTGFANKVPFLAVPFLHASRRVRHVLIRKVKVLPSAGHALLAFVYVSINIVILFTNMESSTMAWQVLISARTGWLSICNLCLVTFLAMKNTPLGYLTAWSYERINILHQIAGYTLMALIIIHGSSYASYFGMMGNYTRLTAREEIWGMAAGGCVLVLTFASSIIRRWWYELFYVIHVMFFVCAVVFIGLHQPEVSKRIMIAICFAGGLWCLDRTIRFLRLVVYSINNSATVHPLPNGGTRIVLKKAPIGATAGSHCFVWIPRARKLEMHPFTIASTAPLEFVVASYDGFTRDLHRYAVENPGGSVKASAEGPYGTFPNSNNFDKVVFIAGGSGASFTFGMALNMLKKMRKDAKKEIVFVWIVKEQATLTWFSDSIALLRNAPNVTTSMALHVTRSSLSALPMSPEPPVLPHPLQQAHSRASTMTTTSSEPPLAANSEKDDAEDPARPPKIKTRGLAADPEKEGAIIDSSVPSTPVQQLHEVTSSIHGVPVLHSRPDVSRVIRDAVESTPKNQRVLVIGCGPDGLMAEVRNTTASLIRPSGPGVELHCEQFGW